MKYNAFISYRHLPKDKFVAETLHKTLESFKLPKSLYSKCNNHSIERVFRDRDELPLSSDLSNPIDAALKESEFLIVICSPQLKESRWCLREIETFKAIHGREKILAVLAEGEPSESFPEAILKEEYEEIDENGNTVVKSRCVEPLAADVRGKSKHQIKKMVKEESLRLIAPMFGLSYDDLKQRHRERLIKKRIAYASVIAGVLAIFGIVSSTMAIKIYRQNKEIKKNYAASLCSESNTLYSEGNLKKARSKAKEAVKNFEMEDSIYALSLVNGENVPYGCHNLSDSIDCKSGVLGMCLSPDNSCIAIEDGTQQVTIRNLSSGKESSLSLKAITFDNGYASFISDNLFCFDSEKGMVIYDISNESENVMSSDFSKIIPSPKESVFATVTYNSVKFIDSSSLECKKDILLDVNTDCVAAYSNDGQFFIIAMMGDNLSSGKIYLIDTKSYEVVAENAYNGGIPVSAAISDGKYTVSLSNTETGSDTTLNAIYSYDFDGNILWKTTEEKTPFCYVDYCNDVIFTYQSGLISLLDAKTGDVINDAAVAGSANGCEKRGEGKYIVTTLDSDVIEYDVLSQSSNLPVNYNIHPILKNQQAFYRDNVLYIHFIGADYISVYTVSENEEATLLSENADEYIEKNQDIAWFVNALAKMYTRNETDKIPKGEEASIILFSPDHSLLACNGAKSYNIYKNGEDSPLYSLDLNTGMLNYVFFSEDCNLFAANYKNGTLELYDSQTGELITTLEKDYQYVFDVVYRPELDAVIVDASDKTVILDNSFNVKITYPKTVEESAVGYDFAKDKLILRSKNSLSALGI